MKTKIIIAASAFVLLAAGCNQTSSTTGYASPTPVANQSASNTPTPTNNNDAVAASASATDSSDASITQDMGNIDTQMNGLNSDSSNVDQSLNERSSAGSQ